MTANHGGISPYPVVVVMIVSFSVENWMSFRDKATLSMVASRERQHGERLARLDRYQMRLLPAAVVYGGNASGKTNLFKALAFAKNQVVTGTQPGRPYRGTPLCLGRGAFEAVLRDSNLNC